MNAGDAAVTQPGDGAARIVRVNGPLVEVADLTGVAMYDIVELGEQLLPGEAVAIRGVSRPSRLTSTPAAWRQVIRPAHAASRSRRVLAPACSAAYSTACSGHLTVHRPGSSPDTRSPPRATGYSASRQKRRPAIPSATATPWDRWPPPGSRTGWWCRPDWAE